MQPPKIALIHIHPDVYERVRFQQGWHRRLDALRRRFDLILAQGHSAADNVVKTLGNGGIKFDWNASDRMISKVTHKNDQRVLVILALEDAACREDLQGPRFTRREGRFRTLDQLCRDYVPDADQSFPNGRRMTFLGFRPSGFDWDRLRLRVYQHVEQHHPYASKPALHTITTNYRSPESVVNPANAITTSRGLRIYWKPMRRRWPTRSKRWRSSLQCGNVSLKRPPARSKPG